MLFIQGPLEGSAASPWLQWAEETWQACGIVLGALPFNASLLHSLFLLHRLLSLFLSQALPSGLSPKRLYSQLVSHPFQVAMTRHL